MAGDESPDQLRDYYYWTVTQGFGLARTDMERVYKDTDTHTFLVPAPFTTRELVEAQLEEIKALVDAHRAQRAAKLKGG